jgi:hypothetical protein
LRRRDWARSQRAGRGPLTWAAGFEWEVPKAGAVPFSPSLEDAMAVQMDDLNIRLGEDDGVAEVGKWAQADEGMGKGRHDVAQHRFFGKRWGRGKSRAGDGSLGDAVRDLDPNSWSPMVKVVDGCVGRKVEATGARVGNASV